jgi:hypothetical protein
MSAMDPKTPQTAPGSNLVNVRINQSADQTFKPIVTIKEYPVTKTRPSGSPSYGNGFDHMNGHASAEAFRAWYQTNNRIGLSATAKLSSLGRSAKTRSAIAPAVRPALTSRIRAAA